MQYQGGKTRLAKDIAKLIREHGRGKTTYIEPFMGGASVLAEVAPSFDNVVAADKCEDIVLLWKAAIDGWVPPVSVSQEEYKSARNMAPSAVRGFIRFGCSFGAKWFGGYAKNNSGTNYAAQASRGVVKKASNFRHAELFHCEYNDRLLRINPQCCVYYMDPPYAGTTEYGAAKGFDHVAFWHHCSSLVALGAVVLVSEYSAPPEWRHVYEKKHRQTLNLNEGRATTEKVFVHI